jgi:hypothetical protein
MAITTILPEHLALLDAIGRADLDTVTRRNLIDLVGKLPPPTPAVSGDDLNALLNAVPEAVSGAIIDRSYHNSLRDLGTALVRAVTQLQVQGQNLPQVVGDLTARIDAALAVPRNPDLVGPFLPPGGDPDPTRLAAVAQKHGTAIATALLANEVRAARAANPILDVSKYRSLNGIDAGLFDRLVQGAG